MRSLFAALAALLITMSLTAGEAEARRAQCSGFFDCLFGGRSGGFGGYSRTRQVVNWPKARKYRQGSIIISTPERALYYVLDRDRAIRYRVGVGRQGFTWSGSSRIAMKKEWPGWTPPARMRARERKKGRILPAYMPGGPNNPLGARALYISGTLYRIHGTNNPRSIGQAMSSGCIRLMNEDVKDLYNRVRVGARVYVYQ